MARVQDVAPRKFNLFFLPPSSHVRTFRGTLFLCPIHALVSTPQRSHLLLFPYDCEMRVPATRNGPCGGRGWQRLALSPFSFSSPFVPLVPDRRNRGERRRRGRDSWCGDCLPHYPFRSNSRVAQKDLAGDIVFNINATANCVMVCSSDQRETKRGRRRAMG